MKILSKITKNSFSVQQGGHNYRRNKFSRKHKLLASSLFCFFLFVSAAFAKDMTIKLIAVNATEDEKEIDIKSPLPKELKPEDILEMGTLKLDYDVDKGSYFVHGKEKFAPKESKKFSIKVRDVWIIAEEEIDLLRQQLDENLKSLENHENYPYARRMSDRLNEDLAGVLAKQENYSQNIERRIEEYRANLQVLETLRNRIFNIDFLKFHSKALDEMDSAKNIKLRIKVTNPFTRAQTIKLKHYLPDEIREADVIEKSGFDVRFDSKLNKTYLSKNEEFQPKEEKEYQIVLKDIWQFNLMKVQDIDDRVTIAVDELVGTIYETSSDYLVDRIMNKLDLIRESTEKKRSIKEHIGMFRVNEGRYEEALADFERIEEMISIVRAKKLEELEGGKVKNVLQKLKALRGLSALSEALFQKTISITVTWRIIMGTIIFMGFFTAVHFVLWAKRSKTMGESLAPKGDEGIKVVPKPGVEKKDEDEDE